MFLATGTMAEAGSELNLSLLKAFLKLITKALHSQALLPPSTCPTMLVEPNTMMLSNVVAFSDGQGTELVVELIQQEVKQCALPQAQWQKQVQG